MEIGSRVEVHVATINGVPRFVAGRVSFVHSQSLASGKSQKRYTVEGDDGRTYALVHPCNLAAIVAEQA